MEFKKDEYVVLTEADFDMDDQYILGHVYKISRTADYFVAKDEFGSMFNGYQSCRYDNSGKIEWRYATTSERDMYDKENKPCFVGIEALKEVAFVEDSKEDDDYTKEIEEFLISCSVK